MIWLAPDKLPGNQVKSEFGIDDSAITVASSPKQRVMLSGIETTGCSPKTSCIESVATPHIGCVPSKYTQPKSLIDVNNVSPDSFLGIHKKVVPVKLAFACRLFSSPSQKTVFPDISTTNSSSTSITYSPTATHPFGVVAVTSYVVVLFG